MTGRIITSDVCVAEGATFLARIEPRFASALQTIAPLPLRRSPDGFQALFGAIISQQVSTASAAAISARVQKAGLFDADRVRAASDDDLRACGLSRPKVRYARALAEARLDYAFLRTVPDEEVITTLTKVPGIGRWSAEIYCMISLGRADVFAPGDLALQESARLIFDLAERPPEKDLRAMAADWSPWRGVAARLLWAYYRHAKNREGIR